MKNITFIALMLCASVAHADSILLYDAAAAGIAPDPTSAEGRNWISSPPVSLIAGPVSDGGTNAWRINDIDGEQLWYDRELSNSQLDVLATTGWEMTARLRMTDAGILADGSIGFWYHTNAANGSERWLIALDLMSNGNLQVRAQSEGAPMDKIGLLVTDGTGSADYHDFTIRNDSGTGAAQFYFDGGLVTFTDGSTSFNPLVLTSSATGRFGAAFGALYFGAGDGGANFQSVELRTLIVPTPIAALSGITLLFAWAGLARSSNRHSVIN